MAGIRSRAKFTEEEDRVIVEEITKGKRYQKAKGVAVWEKIKEHPVLKNHTPISCKKRFVNTLSKSLKKFGVAVDVIENVHAVLDKKETRPPFKRKRTSAASDYTPAQDMCIFRHILSHCEPWNTNNESYWSTCELRRQEVIICYLNTLHCCRLWFGFPKKMSMLLVADS